MSPAQNLAHLNIKCNDFGKKSSFEQFKNKMEFKVDHFWSKIISKMGNNESVVKMRKIPKQTLTHRPESGLRGVWYNFKFSTFYTLSIQNQMLLINQTFF